MKKFLTVKNIAFVLSLILNLLGGTSVVHPVADIPAAVSK
jgi:hypothetical protein